MIVAFPDHTHLLSEIMIKSCFFAILRQHVSVGSLNTNKFTHPSQNTCRASLRNLQIELFMRSVINDSYLSSKKPIVRCVKSEMKNEIEKKE